MVTGTGEQWRISPCFRDTGVPVWTFLWSIYFLSCNFISLDGEAQGLLWKSPPVAVFWPKLTACLPAIADLVALSVTSVTISRCCGLQCGQRHNRSVDTAIPVLVLPSFCLLSQGFGCSNVKVIFFKIEEKILEEDEAEETGDGVWRGNILRGCVLTVSDVGSSPAWPCKETEWWKLSPGKSNYCSVNVYRKDNVKSPFSTYFFVPSFCLIEFLIDKALDMLFMLVKSI